MEIKNIYGIDFSGAKNGGNKIWITSSHLYNNILIIDGCFQAKHLPNSGSKLELCLKAILNFIDKNNSSAFGFDFPFGLPIKLVDEDHWDDFVLSFPQKYPTPEDFKESCYRLAGFNELKRITDINAKTPFSPYNLRIYKQTYHGIKGLLHPLVSNNSVYVLPMHKPNKQKPWVLEVCPASTLKNMGLYNSYKGNTIEQEISRKRILKKLKETVNIKFANNSILEAIISDLNGDAIDSIIAAFATFKAVTSEIYLEHKFSKTSLIEGFVYV